MTVNNLRILHTSPGLPRMVLARAMLDQPDLSSALDVLQHSPRSGGFHFTLAQSGHDALVSVEFCAAVCSAPFDSIFLISESLLSSFPVKVGV